MPLTNFDLGAVEPCLDAFSRGLWQGWNFLKSDEGHLVFASIATLRAIFYYLRRSPLPEASDLAHVLAVTLAVIVVIAVSENQTAIKIALQCKGSPSTKPEGDPMARVIAHR
ncbi:MAG: hypothetical protein WAK01_11555 [Methylocystis sp.]